jgi:starvation-inducible outer membrane lipoprotein
MKTGLVKLSALSVLLTACATTPQSVSPERQSELRARAQECMRAHPAVEQFEVDRFGTVTAYYRMSGSASITDPFFECVRK